MTVKNKGKFYQYMIVNGRLLLTDMEPNAKEAIAWANKGDGIVLLYCVDEEIIKNDGSAYDGELIIK